VRHAVKTHTMRHHPDKIGCLQCASCTETRRFTGNETIIQSNWWLFIGCQ